MNHFNCRCVTDFNPRADFEFIKASIERKEMLEKQEKLLKDVKLAFNRYMDNFGNKDAGNLAFNLLQSSLDSDSDYRLTIHREPKTGFELWGKPITKETARHLIVQDQINSCVNGGDEDHFFSILMNGDEGVENWSNEDISEYLDTLIKENFTQKQLDEAGY